MSWSRAGCRPSGLAGPQGQGRAADVHEAASVPFNGQIRSPSVASVSGSTSGLITRTSGDPHHHATVRTTSLHRPVEDARAPGRSRTRRHVAGRSPVGFWVTVRVGHESAGPSVPGATRAMGRRRLSTACGIRASVSSPGSCCATSRLHVDPIRAGLYFRGETSRPTSRRWL